MIEITDNQDNIASDLNKVNGSVVNDTRNNVSSISVLNGTVEMDIEGENAGLIDIKGSFTLSLQLQYSINGIDFYSLPALNRTTEIFVFPITTTGHFSFEIPTGAKKIRLFAVSYTTGSAIISMTANKGDYFAYEKEIPSTQHVTTTGTAGNGVTLTLPGVTGMSHYITKIRIEKFASSLLTAGTSPILITTTNLAGSRTYSFDASAQAQGTLLSKEDEFDNPLKSVGIGIATTFVCPAITGVIWRVSVDYYLSL